MIDRYNVAVIVLNWNNTADTLDCLRSISRIHYPNVHSIVVDNGSDDNSYDQIRAVFPEVDLVKTGANLGYTGGNNVGIDYGLNIGADFFWLLNDDVIVAPDSLSRLVEAATTRPDSGFLGPMVRIREQPDFILSAGGIFDDQFEPVFRGQGRLDYGQYDQIVEVDFLSGCSLLVSRPLLERVGSLDEDFFAYYEDVEWCYRGGSAGFNTLFVPEALVWHPDTRTRDKDSSTVEYYISRNYLLFLRKHKIGKAQMARTITRYIKRLANWSINPKYYSIRGKRNALWWALIDFYYGRLGQTTRALNSKV